MFIKKNELLNISIIIQTLFYSLLIFAFIKPDSLKYIGLGWLDNILIVLDIITVITLFFFITIKKFKVSFNTLLILSIYFFIGLFTFLYKGDYFTLLKLVGTSFGFALFTDFMIQKKLDVYFKSSILTLTILFTINFITIIIYYPEGIYETERVVGDLYFMGHDNAMIYNLIPLVCLSFLYSYLRNNTFYTGYSLYSIFILFLSEIYVLSATGIIESLMFLAFFIFYKNKYLKKLINPFFLFFIYFLANLLIVFFRVQNNLSWLIENIFYKDITFTGRTLLWDYAINSIYNNKFLGYGVGVYVPGFNEHSYPHPHNLLLDFLFKGGFPSLIIFFVLICYFSIFYYNSKDKVISKFILIPVFILLFGEITSAMPYKIYFWSFFVLIQYTNYIREYYK